MNESLGNLVVYLVGDGTSYSRMLMRANEETVLTVKNINNLANALDASFSKPVIAAAKSTADLSMQFQKTMTVIIGLVGVSKSQVVAWSNEILKIGPSLGKSSQELAKALFFVTSAGLRGKVAMDVLKQSAMAASAGLGDIQPVALAVTSAVNAYQKSGLTAAHATDVLVMAIREGNMEASSLAPVLGRVLPLAAAMGMSFEDLAAGIATLTRTGSSAAEAAVGIQGILAGFQKPAVHAVAALKRVGLNFQQMRNLIRQPGGIITALRMLDKALDIEGDTGELSQIFGNIRPLKASLNFLSQDASVVDKIFSNLNNAAGTTKFAFDQMTQTAAFKVKQMMEELNNLFIRIGGVVSDVVVPPIMKLGQAFDYLGGWLDKLNPTFKQVVVGTVLFAAALLPVATTISMVVNVLAIGLPLISSLVALLISPLVVAGGPIVALLVALGVAVTAFIAYSGGVQKAWDNIVNGATNFWNKIQPIVKAVESVFTEIWGRIVYVAEQAWIAIQVAAKIAWGYVAEITNRVLGKFKGLLESVFGPFQITLDDVIETIANMIYGIEFAIDNWKKFAEIGVIAFTFLALYVRETVRNLFIVELPKYLTYLIENWKVVFVNLANIGIIAFNKLFSTLEGLVDKIPDLLTGKLKISDIFKELGQGIFDSVKFTFGQAPKIFDREMTQAEKELLALLKGKSTSLFNEYVKFLEMKKRKPTSNDEVVAAAERGKEIGQAFTHAIKREVNTIDAVLFRSAEAVARIRRFAAIIRGEAAPDKTGAGMGGSGSATSGGVVGQPAVVFNNPNPAGFNANNANNAQTQLLQDIKNLLMQQAKDRQKGPQILPGNI